MAIKKFTFKTSRPTGRYRSFYPDTHYIKIGKAIIGMIGDKPPHRIKLKVIKDIIEGNCDWKWITLAAEFESVDAAKIFMADKFEAVNKQFKLHIENE